MAEEQSRINPWVRANLDQPDPYTRALIPEVLQEHYDLVISELGSTAVALGEAQERYAAARVARAEFFRAWLMSKPEYPIVTEIPRYLEPTTRDTFIDYIDETGYPVDGNIAKFAKELIESEVQLGDDKQ